MQQCRYYPCFKSKPNKIHFFLVKRIRYRWIYVHIYKKKNNRINEKHALFTNAYMHPNKECPVKRKTRIRCGNFKFKLFKKKPTFEISLFLGTSHK